MTCCDMCGKEIKSILNQRNVEIGNNIMVFARKKLCAENVRRS
jgi:hypothetical protein